MIPFFFGNNTNNTDADNSCDVNKVAGPDNVAVMYGTGETI